MFWVREIKSRDLTEVHNFTIQLVQHHRDQGSITHLSVSQFSELYRLGLFNGILLVTENGTTNDKNTVDSGQQKCQDCEKYTTIGCIIYYPEVSLTHGTKGILLDQFYIDPRFRGQGLGRKLVSVLCTKALDMNMDYVKLVYQNQLGLEIIYERMGFVNETTSGPGLHLFEAYGQQQLNKCIDYFTEFVQPNLVALRNDTANGLVKTKCRETVELDGRIIITMPYYSAYQTVNQACPCPQFVIVLEKIFSLEEQNQQQPKEQQELTEEQQEQKQKTKNQQVNLPTLTFEDIDAETVHSVTSGVRMCAFIEQQIFCSWLGRMLSVTGFLGDSSLLTASILAWRVAVWNKRLSGLLGVVWEVPCGETFLETALPASKPASEVSQTEDNNSPNSDRPIKCLGGVGNKGQLCIEKLKNESISAASGQNLSSLASKLEISNNGENEKEGNTKLSETLLHLATDAVSDDTVKEGWSIAFMNSQAMRQLIATTQLLPALSYDNCTCNSDN